jgi:S1-C subfamily serine protease
VTVTGFNKDLPAKVVGADYDLDLALLKLDAGRELPFLPLGNSDQIRVGNWVIAIGNPYGLDHTVTTGVISAKGRPIAVDDRQYENLLQTDASINPGNSGGPLLNLRGEVVGINTAISAGAQGIGFAIPTSTVTRVLEDLKNNVTAIRPWIGVQVRTVDEDAVRALSLDKAEGALVVGVISGSPADKAGLRQGDVIVEFNANKVTNADELVAVIKTCQVNARVNALVVRNKQLRTVSITIAEKPRNIN